MIPQTFTLPGGTTITLNGGAKWRSSAISGREYGSAIEALHRSYAGRCTVADLVRFFEQGEVKLSDFAGNCPEETAQVIRLVWMGDYLHEREFPGRAQERIDGLEKIKKTLRSHDHPEIYFSLVDAIAFLTMAMAHERELALETA